MIQFIRINFKQLPHFYPIFVPHNSTYSLPSLVSYPFSCYTFILENPTTCLGGFAMFYKVKTVKALPNFILEVTFINHEIKYYDVTPLFTKWSAFESLKTVQGLFEQVKVDAGGYGISWNDDIDLSCNELFFNGKSTI